MFNMAAFYIAQLKQVVVGGRGSNASPVIHFNYPHYVGILKWIIRSRCALDLDGICSGCCLPD